MAFPYPGGKKLLTPFLLELIPEHSSYIEVFGGSATLLINKKRSTLEVYNDIDSSVVNLLLVIRDYPKKFKHKLLYTPYSRKVYEIAISDYKPKVIGRDITCAINFFFLLQASYNARIGAGFQSTNRTKRMVNDTWKNRSKNILDIARRLSGVLIECQDFREIIDRYDYPDAFFFCDPPYYGKEKYYVNDFSKRDHLDLCKILKNIDGKFLLTYNKCTKIKRLYRKFYIIEEDAITSVDLKAKKRQIQTHLIIANYDISDMQYSPFVPEKIYEI